MMWKDLCTTTVDLLEAPANSASWLASNPSPSSCRWVWSSTAILLGWRSLWASTRVCRTSCRPSAASSTWAATPRRVPAVFWAASWERRLTCHCSTDGQSHQVRRGPCLPFVTERQQRQEPHRRGADGRQIAGRCGKQQSCTMFEEKLFSGDRQHVAQSPSLHTDRWMPVWRHELKPSPCLQWV